MKKILLLIMFLVISSGSAKAEQNLSWAEYLSQARNALRNNDSSYAFYKLRKAWLAVPSKDLASPPYQEIKEVLAETYSSLKEPNLEVQAERIRSGDYSTDSIDQSFKQREFNDNKDSYSVEMKKNGILEFTAKGLDSKDGEGVCAHIKITPQEAEQMREQAIRIRQEWKAKMPIVFTPSSKHYDELLSLCQPIKAGERKEATGFDVSPFLPQDVPKTPDF